MNTQLFAGLTALCLLVMVLDLIRRQKMTFKYSVLWLFSGVCVLFFVWQHEWLAAFSKRLGFALLSNFIFFLGLLFLIGCSLLLTVYINEQNSRTERIIQSLALLENRLKKIEDRNSPRS